MKKLLLLAALGFSVAQIASAALYSYSYNSGFENSGNIADGNPSLWSDTRTVSGIDLVIQSVSVTLNLSGGANGDLYAYLSYQGTKLVLLNRVGVGTGSNPTYTFGYASSGYTGLGLQDGGSDVHTYAGTSAGTYSADGRDVSPLADAGTLYGTSRGTFASAFGGLNANGDWSLVFADLSVGGGQTQMQSWDLNITSVPEPVNVALGLFVALALVGHGLRRWRLRAR